MRGDDAETEQHWRRHHYLAHRRSRSVLHKPKDGLGLPAGRRAPLWVRAGATSCGEGVNSLKKQVLSHSCYLRYTLKGNFITYATEVAEGLELNTYFTNVAVETI